MFFILILFLYSISAEWKIGMHYSPIFHNISIKDGKFQNPNGMFAPVMDDIGGIGGVDKIRDDFFNKSHSKIRHNFQVRVDYCGKGTLTFMQSTGLILQSRNKHELFDETVSLVNFKLNIKHKSKSLFFLGLYMLYKPIDKFRLYMGGELALQNKDEFIIEAGDVVASYQENKRGIRFIPCLGANVKLMKKLYLDVNFKYFSKDIDLKTTDNIMPISFKPNVSYKIMSLGLMCQII